MIEKLCRESRARTLFGSVRLQTLLIFASVSRIHGYTLPPGSHQNYSRVISSLVFKTEGILLLSVNRRSESILYSSDPVAVEFLLQISFDSVPVNSMFSEPDALSCKRY